MDWNEFCTLLTLCKALTRTRTRAGRQLHTENSHCVLRFLWFRRAAALSALRRAFTGFSRVSKPPTHASPSRGQFRPPQGLTTTPKKQGRASVSSSRDSRLANPRGQNPRGGGDTYWQDVAAGEPQGGFGETPGGHRRFPPPQHGRQRHDPARQSRPSAFARRPPGFPPLRLSSACAQKRGEQTSVKRRGKTAGRRE